MISKSFHFSQFIKHTLYILRQFEGKTVSEPKANESEESILINSFFIHEEKWNLPVFNWNKIFWKNEYS